MKYTVEYTPQAVEALRKLSPEAAGLIYSWTEKNLSGCEDPRAQGKGKKRGGRWRYKVGAYRLVCEIQGSRIIVLAVTTGAEAVARDHRGQAKRRTPSVFLKSTARQPVKTAALLIVTALLTFAFVSRSSEYLLIRQETERLSGFYRAAGGLTDPGVQKTQYEFEQERGRDASEAIRYLEQSLYVENVDVRQTVSAVIPDLTRAGAPDSIMRTFDTPHEYVEDVLFYGTLRDVSKSSNNTGHLEGDYSFTFDVDEVLVGAQNMIRAEKLVVLINPRDYQAWEGESWGSGKVIDRLEYVDLSGLASEMEPGVRYLLRGSLVDGRPGVVRGSFQQGEEATPVLQFKPLLADGPWFIPVEPGAEADFDSPSLTGLLEEMQIYDDNQHAMTVTATSDMSTMVSTWQEAQLYLVEGRWLTAEDTAECRPVCVLPDAMGAKVGDTLTIKLRDISIPDMTAISSYASIYGYLYQEEDLARLDEIKETSVTIDLEVVGTFGAAGDVSSYMGKIHIPSSLVPETFTHYQRTPEASQVTFSLTSPEVQTTFLTESREEISKLGFQLNMTDNGWEDFQAAAQPMKQSSLYSALVFTAVMAAGLAIVAVVYFYMRRREIPIARAVGVPAKTCVRQLMMPVLLLAGLPGVAFGAGFGWAWTARNAGDTLAVFFEFEGAKALTVLPSTYLFLLGGGALLLLAGMTLFGAVMLVRRPVLELLQGAARAAVAEVGSGKAEPISPVLTEREKAAALILGRPATVRNEKLSLRAGLVARFVWRQTARARLKTALTIVLAAGFTVGLAAIQMAIAGGQERVDWLYENTFVEAELVPTGTYRGASIRRSTVQELKDTGYITDFYLEASLSTGTGFFPYQEDWNSHGVNVTDNSSVSCGLFSFEDERTFLSPAGSGANVTITYHDGWNGAMFAGTYTGLYSKETDERFPVIVPKELYDEYGLQPGSSIIVFSRTVRPFEVAGYYEGVVNNGGPDALLMPLTAAQTVCSGRISYSKAHVTLDPSLNRQVDQFETALQAVASRQGIATLRAAIWDEELRQAVAPLEGGIRLMRVLYPVMLVLSLLCAAGISVLFIMTSAKEAAILRIQGTTQLRTQVIMGLQQTLTCFVGLIVGLAGVLLYVGSARPALLTGIAASSVLCAVAYLVAATVGAVASSVVVTGKNPLELLQVKE